MTSLIAGSCALHGLDPLACRNVELSSGTVNPFRHFDRTTWTGDRPSARPVPTQDSTKWNHRCTSKPRMGFEPTVFEQPLVSSNLCHVKQNLHKHVLHALHLSAKIVLLIVSLKIISNIWSRRSELRSCLWITVHFSINSLASRTNNGAALGFFFLSGIRINWTYLICVKFKCPWEVLNKNFFIHPKELAWIYWTC